LRGIKRWEEECRGEKRREERGENGYYAGK